MLQEAEKARDIHVAATTRRSKSPACTGPKPQCSRNGGKRDSIPS